MNRLLRLMPAVYFVSYLPLGMIFPYLVVDLENNGAQNIGVLLAMPSLMMMMSGPLWGVVADWFQQTVMVLQGAALMAVVGLAILAFGDAGYAMVGMFIYALGWAPMASLTDALTMEALRQEGERRHQNMEDGYGQIRLWGSVGYMVGVLIVGWLVTFSPGWGLIGGCITSLMFLGLLFFVPHLHVTVPRPSKEDTLALMKHPSLLWIFLCSGLHFSVHLASANFIVKHVQALGLSEMVASVAIALGVVVEISVMFAGARLQTYRANRLFQVACGLAVMRWLVMALGVSTLAVVVGQALHGITFGLFWLSAVRLVKGWTPPELSSTGQSLLGTSVGGVGAVIGVYGASVLIEATDTVTFYWVAVIVAMVATLLSLRIECKTV